MKVSSPIIVSFQHIYSTVLWDESEHETPKTSSKAELTEVAPNDTPNKCACWSETRNKECMVTFGRTREPVSFRKVFLLVSDELLSNSEKYDKMVYCFSTSYGRKMHSMDLLIYCMATKGRNFILSNICLYKHGHTKIPNNNLSPLSQ